jgi:hypothetical protein
MTKEQTEKERRAVLRAERDMAMAIKREAVYLYIAERKDVLSSVCVKDLDFFEAGKRYLDWLHGKGHLTRVKKVIDGRFQYVYNAATPYKKPESAVPVGTSLEEYTLIQSATRVFRLIDKRPPATPKSQRNKAGSHPFGGMQSSINMFGGW